jgi:hypothetical protein
MVTLAMEKGAVPAVGPGIRPFTELALRVLGAVLQVLATLAVVRALPPETAGIYFQGFVIAYGLSALLRGKYELFMAHYFIAQPPLDFGIPARAIVRALGIRILVRSALACAVLLVVTTDLDVMSPHFRPYLETYLPFVLGVPFATLALFLAAALRAINRTVGAIMVSHYCMNVAIIVAATVATTMLPEPAFLILSWAFFAGAALAALVGVLITRRIFRAEEAPRAAAAGPLPWRTVFASAAKNGFTGWALAGLQWGPLCVLALAGLELQLAQYAVVTRTAQIIDFLIPAVILVPQSVRFQSRLCRAMRSQRGKFAVDLAVSVVTATCYVVAVAILTPWIARMYGYPYTELTALFVLLYATQWVNGAGRPAIRYLATDWSLQRIRRVVLSSAIAAIVVAAVGVPEYGALAAAAGVLLGAVLENGQALAAALWPAHAEERPSA